MAAENTGFGDFTGAAVAAVTAATGTATGSGTGGNASEMVPILVITTAMYLYEDYQYDNETADILMPGVDVTDSIFDTLADARTTNTTVSNATLLKWLERGYDLTFIYKVNDFWLNFDPPTKTTYRIFGAIYSFITIFGCFGNAFVIYMFLRFKSLRTPATMLVLNLAVSDFLMLAKCPIAIYNNFNEGPALGDNACLFYGFLGGLSGTAAIGTLTAIALDRYYVVVHPLNTRHSPSKLRQYCIPFIWMYSFAFALVPALDIGLSVYTPEGFLTTCSFDYLNKQWPARLFMFVFFVGAWLIPLIIICYSYFYILKVVFAAKRIQSNRNTNKTEQKLAFIVFLIIGMWFIAWTPYTVVALSGICGKEQYISPTGSMIPALFCKTAACIDPYIYAVSHSRFRAEFARLIRRYKTGQRRRSSATRSTATRMSLTRRCRANSETDYRDHPIEVFTTLPVVRERPDEEQAEEISAEQFDETRF